MHVSLLAQLDPASLRAALPGFVSGYIGDPEAAARDRARIQELVTGWSGAQLEGVLACLSGIGSEHRLYTANLECRLLARAWARDVVTSAELLGHEHLRAAMSAGPTVIIGNHLSYYDSSATDVALAWGGHEDLAERVFAAAGPKVYSDLFRRVAAASLNTLPVPQSTSLGHTEQISPRELARRAISSVKAAEQALASGHALLVYPEGSRTRTGRLRSFLRGVHRYLSSPELRIVPAAITGTDRIMGLESDRIQPGPVTLRFGPPIDVAGAGGPRDALAVAHRAVAELLPSDQRPDPQEPPVV